MTKKELAAVQELTQHYEESTGFMDLAFEILQRMARDNNLTACCSARGNMEQLMKTDSAETAANVYTNYVKYSTKCDVIMELAHNLANAQGHNFNLGPQL